MPRNGDEIWRGGGDGVRGAFSAVISVVNGGVRMGSCGGSWWGAVVVS